MILEGKISVKAALLGGKREVKTVYVQKGRHDKETAFILAKAREKGIMAEVIEREKLDALAEGKTHGGILCDAGIIIDIGKGRVVNLHTGCPGCDDQPGTGIFDFPAGLGAAALQIGSQVLSA